MTELGTERRPLRVAVVGSGPSGFFAVEALFRSKIRVRTDMFERLPTPFGLVRAGIAPDHAKTKGVIKTYAKLAADERFAFWGNVTIGRDMTVEELRVHYDAVVFATGAETDASLDIPGEHLPGSHSATEFVGWYNAHPDHSARLFDLSCETAVIIGQGNVAVDVARILSKSVDELRHTDIAEYALDALAESKIRDIYLIGRRGPVQAKFTSAELRELGGLSECDPVVDPADLSLNRASQLELDDHRGEQARRNMAVLEEFVTRRSSGKKKRCMIRFLCSPLELRGQRKIETVILERNTPAGEPFAQRATGTGQTQELACGILFRSVGYRGRPIPGVPFDDRRGIFPNQEGRIMCDGEPVTGLYAAGWIRRGPTGLIGQNKADSAATITALLEDLDLLPPCQVPDTDALRETLSARNVRIVGFDDWLRIDAAETARGQVKGKPREKFATIEDMLAVLA